MLQNNGGQNDLDGWEEIAGCLGVTSRTAQNYERDYQLPVHRRPGPRGRVYAYRLEIEEWRRTYDRTPPGRADNGSEAGEKRPRIKWTGALVSALIGLVFLFGATIATKHWIRRHQMPDDFQIRHDELVLVDQSGSELTHFRFDHALDPDIYNKAKNYRAMEPWFGDLTGSGSIDVLFPDIPRRGVACFLDCFRTGEDQPRWRFHAGGKILTNADGTRFDDIYFINQYLVLTRRHRDGRRIVVSSNHYLSYPDQIAVLDSNGRVVSEYWHPGHLLAATLADLKGYGPDQIILGGVNDGFQQATLVVLDPDDVRGQGMVRPGDPHRFDGIGQGSERVVILFPYSCLMPYNRVSGITIFQQMIIATVNEYGQFEKGPSVIYRFDLQLNLLDVTPSGDFLAEHRRLENAGTLHHSFSARELAELEKIRMVRPGD